MSNIGLKVGDCFSIKTKTATDRFGTCYYEVVEGGITNPKNPKDKSWMKFLMLGGTGPSAKPGLEIFDDPKVVIEQIKKNGKFLSKKEAKSLSDAIMSSPNRNSGNIDEW